MIIRKYAPDDWVALGEVHDAARLVELRLSVGAQAFRSLPEVYAEDGLFDGDLWVADADECVVGFVAVHEGEITWLYVHPARHRQGIGRRLLEHALTVIAGNATAWVLVGNDPALQLYLSVGFSIKETKTGHLAGSPEIPAAGYCLERRHSQ